MSADQEPGRAQLEAVELLPEYPGMIKVTTADGTWWHYLADDRGVLELGYPYRLIAGGYRVHLFVPLAPGARPGVLKVEPL